MTVLVMTLRADPGYSLSRVQCYPSDSASEHAVSPDLRR